MLDDCGEDDALQTFVPSNSAYATNAISDWAGNYTSWLLSIGAISVIIALSNKKLDFLMIPGLGAAALGAIGLFWDTGSNIQF